MAAPSWVRAAGQPVSAFVHTMTDLTWSMMCTTLGPQAARLGARMLALVPMPLSCMELTTSIWGGRGGGSPGEERTHDHSLDLDLGLLFHAAGSAAFINKATRWSCCPACLEHVDLVQGVRRV